MSETHQPTKLSEIAGATRLKGKVCITDAKGITHEYVNEVVAWEAWKDRLVEHRRGAFFEKAAPAPSATEPMTEEPAPKIKRAK